MRRQLRVLAATLALAACHAPIQSSPAPARVPPAWSRSADIYEVNIRQYTPEGTFAAFQRHLPRLRALGVDILWIMPVQPIGKVNRKGPLGSPYSIADYTAINPEYGSADDFRRVVDEAHRLGMHVILDWVANHTAFDNRWVYEHRGWYVLRPDGSISNARDNEGHETDWTDVAELNYDNPDMRREMIADMRWWLENMHIDGFRCDVALGVPMDFWNDARRELAAVRPDIFMLAEAESPVLYSAFDMSYGWEFHHLLNELAQGKQGTEALDQYLAQQRATYPPDAYRMYFTSNHDENAWNGTEFERMGTNMFPAFVLAATMQSSMPLLYTGQEVSNRKRLRFFDKDTVNWNGPSLAPFYHSMFELKHGEEALANGAWGGAQASLTTDGGSRVYAFSRNRGASRVVVAVNFGDTAVTARYDGLRQPGSYIDWFTRDTARLDSSGRIGIPAHGYRVFVGDSSKR